MDWLLKKKIRIIDPFRPRLCLAEGVVDSISADGIKLVNATIGEQSRPDLPSGTESVTFTKSSLDKYVIKEL